MSRIYIRGGGNSIDLSNDKFVKTQLRRYIVEIIVRPATWLGVVQRLKVMLHRLFNKAMPPTDSNPDKSYSLLSIAVSKKWQGKGVATEMVKEFERRCAHPFYRLSVHSNNARAIAFYRRMGMTEFRANNGLLGFEKVLRK